MKNQDLNSRRKFLQQIAATSLVATPFASFAAQEKAEERILHYEKPISPSDKIRIGVIGYGVQGHFDVGTALKVPGVELAGVCDLYTGRLENAKEEFGKDLFTTRNYKELLDRKDIDAVIVATHDVWHARITIDALAKGKHVYIEKPMIAKISEGAPVIAAAKKSGKVLQVGSQRVSSIVYAKAKELIASGEIGKLNMVSAMWDRQNSVGAWEYTIPKDANPTTIDWDKFVEATGKMEFDAKKFFWWRAHKGIGTGVAGDLFIHLLSGTHLMTNSKGPQSISSIGHLSYWKDGRTMPDVMLGVMQYPECAEHAAFSLALRVNLISGSVGKSDWGSVEGFQLIGTEGAISIDGNELTLSHSILPEAPAFDGYDSMFTFSKSMQEEMRKDYNAKWSDTQKKRKKKADINFKAPEGYSDHLDHFTNFFDAIRTGKPAIEGAEFGFRATAPALACNESMQKKKVVNWDPVNMKLV